MYLKHSGHLLKKRRKIMQMKIKKIIPAVVSLIFMVWLLVSWADVLATQMDAGPHAWNLFMLITRIV